MGKSKKYFGGDATEVKKPLQIDMYNRFMGSVDKADQLLEPYSYDRKFIAWLKKLGIHFIERMVLTAFLMYKSQQSNEYKKKADYLYFIRDVAEGLISDHSRAGKQLIDDYKVAHPPRGAPAAQPQAPAAQSQAPAAHPQAPAAEPAPTVWHNLVKIPPTTKKNPTKACRECYRENKKRREVSKHCVGCHDKPGLHDGDCYNKYHDRLRDELEAEDAPRQPIRPQARSPQVAPAQPIRPPARSTPEVAPPQRIFPLARSPPLTRSRRGRRGGIQTAPQTSRAHTTEVAGPSGLQPAPQASGRQIASRTSKASREDVASSSGSTRVLRARRPMPSSSTSSRAPPSKRPHREPAKKRLDGSYIMTDVESDPDDPDYSN